MRPICVDRLKLPVGDLERSVAFYRAAAIHLGAPGPRSKYSPGYHGAFLLDPDGHNVEAVWHAPVEAA